MTALLGDIGIFRYFQGTKNGMLWITAQDDIPQWCSLEIIVGYVVDLQYSLSNRCQILDLNIYLNFIGGQADADFNTQQAQVRNATKLVSHQEGTYNRNCHYRTESFPMSFSPKVSSNVTYQLDGRQMQANHSSQLEPAVFSQNSSLLSLPGLLIHEYFNVEE